MIGWLLWNICFKFGQIMPWLSMPLSNSLCSIVTSINATFHRNLTCFKQNQYIILTSTRHQVILTFCTFFVVTVESVVDATVVQHFKAGYLWWVYLTCNNTVATCKTKPAYLWWVYLLFRSNGVNTSFWLYRVLWCLYLVFGAIIFCFSGLQSRVWIVLNNSFLFVQVYGWINHMYRWNMHLVMSYG